MLRYFPPVLRLFLRDKIIRWCLIISSGIGLFGLLLIILVFPRSANLPLHYNIAFGIDYVGQWYEVFWLPVLIIILTVINGLVALLIWRRDRVLSYFLSVGTVYLSVILLAALGLITYLSKTYAG